MPLGPANPHGVGFDITQRVLQRESEAQRMCAPERSRVWKVGGGMGGALEHHTPWAALTCMHCCDGALASTNTLPALLLPVLLPATGPERARAQSGDGQAGGLEADARHALPAPAGAREEGASFGGGAEEDGVGLLCAGQPPSQLLPPTDFNPSFAPL